MQYSDTAAYIQQAIHLSRKDHLSRRDFHAHAARAAAPGQPDGPLTVSGYVIKYGWAIVIIAVAANLLLYMSTPHTPAQGTCTVIQGSGVECAYIMLSANSTGGTTKAYVYLLNQETYYIGAVSAYAQLGASNTSTVSCYPAAVKPSAAINCVIPIPGTYKPGGTVTGKVYVMFSACGQLKNYSAPGGSCAGAPSHTVYASFSTPVNGVQHP